MSDLQNIFRLGCVVTPVGSFRAQFHPTVSNLDSPSLMYYPVVYTGRYYSSHHIVTQYFEILLKSVLLTPFTREELHNFMNDTVSVRTLEDRRVGYVYLQNAA